MIQELGAEAPVRVLDADRPNAEIAAAAAGIFLCGVVYGIIALFMV